MRNTFQHFFQKLIQHGLEYFGLFYGSYRGVVVDNRDPEMLGRLKISCSAIYGDDVPPYWAWPKVSFAGNQIGFFAIPQIGDGVYIECECGNPKYPIWSGGWWAKPGQNEVPEVARLTPPTNRVWQTTSGHRIELDDTSGAEKIKITDKSGNYILIDSITRNEEHLVGGKKIDEITGNKEETVGGNKLITIVSNKEEIIGGNKTVAVAGNMTQTVDGKAVSISKGDQEENILGSQKSDITADKEENIGGSWNITVSGPATINAPEVITIGGLTKLSAQSELYKLIKATFLDLHNSHTHGGIYPGSGNTGIPNQQAGAEYLTTNTEAS
jgi:hypothetical protein